jgi:hypothetical protein
MSAAAGNARRRMIVWLAGAAGTAMLMGGLSFLPPARPPLRAEVGERVLPGFAANADKIQLVMVTTGEEAYHLVRNDDEWVLAEQGSYPVEPERIAELTRALSAITYARPMTRDDKKFDRIGLGDPATGGTGALLEVGDGSGTSFAKLLVGYRDGTSYLRMPADLQAWAVAGATLPPLQRGARWLDLDIVDVVPSEIADVQVRPRNGPSYRLVPSNATGQQFDLAPPYASRRAVAPFAPTLAATALSRFAPVDVARADTVMSGAPESQYIVRTRQGVSLIVQAWRSDDRCWVTVGAATGEGASAEARTEADAINARAAGWAFALSELDWGAFATPLAALVE